LKKKVQKLVENRRERKKKGGREVGQSSQNPCSLPAWGKKGRKKRRKKTDKKGKLG